MQAIDRLGRLLDLGLQPAGDFAQHRHGGRQRQGGWGLLDDSEPRHGLALCVVGSALGEMRLLIVLIAFGLAHRDRHRQLQRAEKALEIGGILTGGIDADVKVCLRMLLVQ